MGRLFGWPGEAADARPGRLCVLGAPHDGGNPIRRGACRAPDAIRRASLVRPPPRSIGLDRGDVGDAGTRDLAAFLGRLAGATATAREQGLCPLVLGGDHAISFAVVSALQAAGDLGVVWFDAHTDFSPWPGGAAHNHKQVLRRIAGLGGVRRVVQIGYRGFTTGDERHLSPLATVLTTDEARSLDTEAVVALLPDDLPWYLSIDIDVVDPLWAPGTGAPVPDGLSPARLRALLGAVVRRRRVIGLDLVEVNPALDAGAETSEIAAELLHAVADDWTFSS